MASGKKLPGENQARGVTVVKDPEFRAGRYRLMQRTDGPFIAVDESLPPGERTVRESKDPEVVKRWMTAQAAKDKEEEAKSDGEGSG